MCRLQTLSRTSRSGWTIQMYPPPPLSPICRLSLTPSPMQPLYDFLNITTPSQCMNGYQKRLVHQIVRAEFPSLATIGKPTFVQVVKNDPAADKFKREERRAKFDKDLQKAIGLRHLIDALFKSKKPLVGHNLITDLVYLYQCFIGNLPDTEKEFAAIIHAAFPVCVSFPSPESSFMEYRC